jgi:methylated-DNA-[protein]-cysteine S-methyltransferase
MSKSGGKKITWTCAVIGQWEIYCAATEKGLCYVHTPDASFAEFAAWLHSRYPGCELIRNDRRMEAYAAELEQYIQGRRTEFTVPLDLNGTDFQRQVWEALLAIPYGATLTYSEIAGRIGKPAAVRAVGTAIGANPVLIVNPCHRVIGKNGAWTGYRGGMDVKAELLRLEREGARE